MSKIIVVLLVLGLSLSFAFPHQPTSKSEALDNQKLGDEPIPVMQSTHHPTVTRTKTALLGESFSGVTFPPTNWNIIQTNFGTQGGYPCYWSRFTEPGYAVYSEPASAGLWWSYGHQDEWLISPEIFLSGSSTNRYYLKWWYYGFKGSNDGDHYYTKISTDGGNTWNVIYDLSVLPSGWNCYYAPVELDLSAYAGQTVKIAFHATDGPANTGISYVWFIDDVEIGYPFLDDMGVSKLNAINTIPIVVGDPDTFFIRVRNYGTNPQDNIPVVMMVDDITIDAINISLDTLGHIDTFLVWTPAIAGDYTIKFFTQLATDENLTNDTLYKDITVCPQFHSVPYYKDFDEDWGEWGDNPPFCGWTIIDNGNESPKRWNRNDWFHGAIANPPRNVAAVRYSPVEQQNEWLISPRIDCSVDTNYTLNYWHQYEGYRNARPDTGYILVSVDDGLSWTVIEKYIGGISEIVSYGYKTHNITNLVNGENDVRIAFRYLAHNAGKWMVDDFSVVYTPAIDAVPILINVADTIFVKDTFNVNVIVRNAGTADLLAPWYVYLQIRNNKDSLSVNNTLTPGETLSLVFQKTIAEPDTYNLTAWTDYPDDEFPLNDVITKRIRISGWLQLADAPIPDKGIKDGGALELFGDTIYALRGGNTREFYAYDPTTDTWFTRDEMPIDSAIPKNVKAGGALAACGDKIYAFKGSNTKEFWVFTPATQTWSRMRDIPFLSPVVKKRVKAGGALVAYDDIIYAFKGGNTNEFWMYNPLNDSWSVRCSLVTPDGKKIKGGGALETMNDVIYAFVGSNTNYFYAYSPTTNIWIRKADPSFDPRSGARAKKKVKDGGSLLALDGKLYAFKGGNTNHFGYYDAIADTWFTLEIIPGIRKVKSGGSLTAYNGFIYALKGGNTKELWCYSPSGEKSKVNPEFSSGQKSNMNIQTVNSELEIGNWKLEINVTPNPFTKITTIRYTVPVAGKVILKLYDVAGKLVKTLNDGYQNTGVYSMNLTNINSGVYFLRLVLSESEKSHRTEMKLIVQ